MTKNTYMLSDTALEFLYLFVNFFFSTFNMFDFYSFLALGRAVNWTFFILTAPWLHKSGKNSNSYKKKQLQMHHCASTLMYLCGMERALML